MQAVTRLMEELSLALKQQAEAEATAELLAGQLNLSPDHIQMLANSIDEEDRDPSDSHRAIELHMKYQELAQKKQETYDMLQEVIKSVKAARNGILYKEHEWDNTQKHIREEYETRIQAEKQKVASIEQRKREVMLGLATRKALVDKIEKNLN